MLLALADTDQPLPTGELGEAAGFESNRRQKVKYRMDTHLEPAGLVDEQSPPEVVGPDVARRWELTSEGHDFVDEHDLKAKVVSVEEATERAVEALEIAESVETSLHNQRVKLDRWKEKFQSVRDEFQTVRDVLTLEESDDGDPVWIVNRNFNVIETEIKSDIREIETSLDQLREDIDGLDQSTADLRDDHEDLVADLHEHLNTLDDAVSKLDENFRDFADRVDDQEARLDDLEERMERQEEGLLSRFH
ncbi:hypothetical protein [Halorhabdus amylolytica]|uniref:hypothetical protein n=1 Tax=Halorhabdus amylolytica TaxID=2559573 RepID=UPI0010AA311A|nr:hypothetical protein [Halorhabdus amylolytica]